MKREKYLFAAIFCMNVICVTLSKKKKSDYPETVTDLMRYIKRRGIQQKSNLNVLDEVSECIKFMKDLGEESEVHPSSI